MSALESSASLLSLPSCVALHAHWHCTPFVECDYLAMPVDFPDWLAPPRRPGTALHLQPRVAVPSRFGASRDSASSIYSTGEGQATLLVAQCLLGQSAVSCVPGHLQSSCSALRYSAAGQHSHAQRRQRTGHELRERFARLIAGGQHHVRRGSGRTIRTNRPRRAPRACTCRGTRCAYAAGRTGPRCA